MTQGSSGQGALQQTAAIDSTWPPVLHNSRLLPQDTSPAGTSCPSTACLQIFGRYYTFVFKLWLSAGMQLSNSSSATQPRGHSGCKMRMIGACMQSFGQQAESAIATWQPAAAAGGSPQAAETRRTFDSAYAGIAEPS